MESLKKFRGCFRFDHNDDKMHLKINNLDDTKLELSAKVSSGDIQMKSDKIILPINTMCKFVDQHTIMCIDIGESITMKADDDTFEITKCSFIKNSFNMTQHILKRVDDSECSDL